MAYNLDTLNRILAKRKKKNPSNAFSEGTKLQAGRGRTGRQIDSGPLRAPASSGGGRLPSVEPGLVRRTDKLKAKKDRATFKRPTRTR